MEEKKMKKQMEKQKSKFPAVKLARAAVGVLSVVLLNPPYLPG
jgi:ribosome recycling factor